MRDLRFDETGGVVSWLHHPMPLLNAIVVRQGDPPLWPNLDRDLVVDLGEIEIDVVFLEGGMSSGNASVMLRIPTPDGHWLFGETSLSVLIAALAVARGAFPDEFADGPFAGGVAPTGLSETPGSN